MKRLKIIFLMLIIFGLAIWIITNLLRLNHQNHYNTWTEVITCSDHCLHEIGHKLDDRSGWISATPQFRKAIPETQLPKFKNIPIRYWFYFLNKKVYYAEIYASYLERYNADFNLMPHWMRPFYNQDLLNEIMQEEGYELNFVIKP